MRAKRSWRLALPTRGLGVSVLAAAALAACGGDDGDGTSRPPCPASAASPAAGCPVNDGNPPPSNPNNPTNPAAPASVLGGSAGTGLTYEVLPGRADLTSENREGARGYGYVTDLASYDASSQPTTSSVFLNNGGGTYAYVTQPSGTSPAAWVQALNAQGQNGYLFKGFTSSGGTAMDMLVKNNAKTLTYTYEILAAQATAAADVQQMNGKGQSGWIWLGPVMTADSAAPQNLYVKPSGAPQAVSYTLADAATSSAALSTLLQTQAANGWMYRGPVSYGGTANTLFMQFAGKPPVSYTIAPAVGTADPTAMADALNAMASKGYYWYGTEAFGSDGSDRVDVFYQSPLVVPQPMAGYSNP